MAHSNEAIALLKRIAVAVEFLALNAARAGAAAVGAEVADDRDLDGQYGDPIVKFNPRDWHGDSCKGLAMSDCPAEFLDLLAGTFDYFAKQAEDKGETTNAGKPVAPYKRRDAARARGWAKRLRAGWKPAAEAGEPPAGFDVSGFEDVTDLPDSEIPF